ncbi:MAG: hypothetical protein HKP45_05655 [Winogradskyella sp.]|nr:hypothetical protein [Winogradskyella sp.]NNK40123.1 hypothetical protein [Winogradskyella sp.]NNL83437.1 hypothetical protein [Winogradskyella sp.]
MKKNTLDNLFKQSKESFNTEEPHPGHEMRFLEKLKQQNNETGQNSFNWKPFLLVAASLIIAFAVFTNTASNEIQELANVSPELETTENYFAATIQSEMMKLQSQRSTENEKIINDALDQLRLLEIEYESLKQDLKNSGEDQRVIYAMITNYKQRIEILEQVLERIENIKQLKQV